MFSTNFDGFGIEKLLDDKSLSLVQKRRMIATSIALKFIAAVVSSSNTSYKLEDEMKNLSKYTDQIEACLISQCRE